MLGQTDRRRQSAGLRHRAQEGLQVLGDDLVEHGVLGVAGPVDPSLEGHGPQVGSRRRLAERVIHRPGWGRRRPDRCRRCVGVPNTDFRSGSRSRSPATYSPAGGCGPPQSTSEPFERCFRHPETACFRRVILEGDLPLRTMRDCWRKRDRDQTRVRTRSRRPKIAGIRRGWRL
jgi:hypothetical protein